MLDFLVTHWIRITFYSMIVTFFVYGYFFLKKNILGEILEFKKDWWKI